MPLLPPAATASRYRTVILQDGGELRRLLPEWWALWSRTARATPFSSPAWLLPWWDAFQPGELFAAAVRRDGRLVGFAPFYIEEGALGRRLLPLGIGVTDDLDVLIDGAPSREVAAAIVDAYRHRAVRWDSWSLEEMAPDALARRLPVGPLLDGGRAQSARPVLTLPGSLAAWRGTSAGRRWRKSWNRVARHDEIRIVEAEPETAGALFEALVSLHTLRWEASGEPGVLSDPAVLRFHRDAVPRLQASDLLRLSALSIDGAIVGAYYGLAHRGRAYGYLNGFDPALGFDSPGTALLGHAIQNAIAEGCTEFDFLRGQEPYKYAWGAVDRWNDLWLVRSAPAADHSGGGFGWREASPTAAVPGGLGVLPGTAA